MSGSPNISGQQIGPAVETVQVYTPIVGTFDAFGNLIQLYGAGGVPLNLGVLTNPMTTAGDMIDGGTGGVEQRLAIGTSGQVLTVSAGAPAWQTPAFVNPMTTAGDIIDATTGGAPQRLAVGSNGQVLTVVTGAPAWQTPAASFANPMTNAGDLIDGGTAGAAQRLGIGSTGNVLTVVAGAPTWQAPAFVNPMTTAGDIIDGGSSGTPQRLAAGSNGQVLTISSSVPAWATPGSAPPVNPQTGTTYTFVLSDAPQQSNYQGIVTMNNSSANTFTIDTHANVAFPNGTVIAIIQIGTGQTTIAAAGGVTLHNPSSVTARAQYSTLVIHQIAQDSWILGGDMT